VHEDVQRGEPAEDGPGHLAERRLVRALEDVAPARRQQPRRAGAVGVQGIVADDVDGRLAPGRAGPGPGLRVAEQRLAEDQGADHVVEQVPHGPLGARGGQVMLVGPDPAHDLLGGGAGPGHRVNIHERLLKSLLSKLSTATMDPMFAFPADTLTFLADLSAHNDRADGNAIPV
jgi:hypothetical protein